MFRFTIRDVLWLTVVVAMGLAWLVDRQRASGEREELATVMENILDRHGEKVRHGENGWWWILPNSSREWEVLQSELEPPTSSDLDFLDALPRPSEAAASD